MANRKAQNTRSLSLLEKIFLGILLVIFGGIVLHAPLSVGLGALFPDYELLIKSWKEILMAVATLLGGIILYRTKQTKILKEPLMIGIGLYAALHLLLVTMFARGLTSSTAGLAIDLRYVLFFVLIYIVSRLYPDFRQIFVKVGIVGALIVTIFALLQVFVLPVDILQYIGYNINTIVPYLTVDQNQDYIRINSTLRGPNPLGAYATIVLATVMAWVLSKRPALVRVSGWMVTLLIIGGLVALWASYSRSALVAAIFAVAIVVVVTKRQMIPRRMWIAGAVISLAIIGGLVAARDSSFVSNVILHENPGESNNVNSNEGHVESLQQGIERLLVQPFGAGIGSTGSASLYGNTPFILENQYLFIAHEVGWLGLVLFIAMFIIILYRLWMRRVDWLALGVFASGIGLALIGLLLPVWVDDTVSIVWWGLAGLVVGGVHGTVNKLVGGDKEKKEHDGT